MADSKRRRRVLVLVHSYYLRDTRPRRYATALAAEGWEVDVVCARDEGEPWIETVKGVRIHRLPARRRRGSKLRYVFEYVSFAAMALVAVTALAARRRYDVVHVVGIPNFIAFAALLPKAQGSRIFLDMRDPLPEFYEGKYSLPTRHPLIRAFTVEERISSRFAGNVLTSHPMFAALYRRTGLPPSRISVVWNAPDPALFREGEAARVDPGTKVMLYTGTVAPRYGVDLALEALIRLRDEIPDLRLRIVGDGDIVEQMVARAREAGVEDRVAFDGPLPLDRIPAIVRESWLGVQPNRWDALMRYSFSQKIVEWARLGLPVVCGETEALRDTFGDDALLYHRPGDLDDLCERIREAAKDPEALARRAERARAVAGGIRYEDQVARLVTLFETGRAPSL